MSWESWETNKPSSAAAEIAVQTLLAFIGEDFNRDGLKETPARVVRALEEMTNGYDLNPKNILATTFEESSDELILLNNISFVSMCEHHLLPFVGVATVGYLPGKVVGISKLARLVKAYAARLQIQERLTTQIADAIKENLEARGVGVIIRASHLCMSCRGVREPNSTMVTSAMLGVLREKDSARAEFLQLAQME